MAARRPWAGVLCAGLALGGAWVGATPTEPTRPEPAAATHVTWLYGDTLVRRADGPPERPSDRLIDWLSQRLPQREHRRTNANARRAWMLIEAGEPVCTMTAVRTPERERQAYFTDTVLMPPPVLVVRTERAAEVPRRGEAADLTALLVAPGWQGLAILGRSYGPELDRLLAARPAAAGLRLTTATDFGSNALPMLVRGRMDYTVEYQRGLALLPPAERAQLTILPIDGAEQPLRVGIACPRNDWGRTLMAEIDRVLSTPEGAALLRQTMAPSATDGSERFQAQLNAFYERRARPGN